MNKKINIWNNNFCTIESLVNDMKKDELYADFDNEMLWSEALGLNELYLKDEMLNLDIKLNQPIIAAIDMELWNGYQIGINTAFGSNVHDIFKAIRNPDYEEFSFFIEDNNVIFEGVHHDGTNRVVFRKLKENKNIGDIVNNKTNQDNFWNNYYKYTESIAPEICNVYGV